MKTQASSEKEKKNTLLHQNVSSLRNPHDASLGKAQVTSPVSQCKLHSGNSGHDSTSFEQHTAKKNVWKHGNEIISSPPGSIIIISKYETTFVTKDSPQVFRTRSPSLRRTRWRTPPCASSSPPYRSPSCPTATGARFYTINNDNKQQRTKF